MSEWREILIDSACSRLSSGKAISSSLIKDKGDYPVYGGNGIRGFTNTYNFDGECAIIGRQGASCGNVRYFSGKAYMTEHAVVAVPTKEHNAYYLSCVLASLKLGRLSGQSAQPGIGVGLIGKQTITMPSLATQQKIASILFSLDSKIAVNRRICENLEAQAQALFKHWFIDFVPFLDKPSGKAERKNGQFVESELGMIPEGWRVGTLEELCSFISRGLSPKYQFGTNELVLGQTCVRNNIVTLNNAREHQPKENCNKYVKKWDVLLNSTGIGSLGRVGVVYFDKTNVCFDSHLTVVRTKEDIYRYYVGRNLLNRQKELENMAVGSTGQTELPKKDVLVMPILIPNSDVLPEFNDIIENIGNKIYTLIAENLRLSTLRDTLLPKLMSGQIKVNEMEKGL